MANDDGKLVLSEVERSQGACLTSVAGALAETLTGPLFCSSSHVPGLSRLMRSSRGPFRSICLLA